MYVVDGGVCGGSNSHWKPERQDHEDENDGQYCYGYVVVEVWGSSNVTTHWKRRDSSTNYAVFNGLEPGGQSDNGDVFEYTVPWSGRWHRTAKDGPGDSTLDKTNPCWPVLESSPVGLRCFELVLK
ncbi:MAG: hypothetical protein ACYST6_12720 [Planctomycetota bacterium]